MTSQKIRAARLSIISNTLLIAMKLVVGIVMSSVSVISEAVHSGIDLIAAIIAYFSVREASKPADREHRFGHGKIENVSATIEALLIFAAGIYIIVEALNKLRGGHFEIESLGIGAGVMAISAIVNWIISSRLLKVAMKTDSVALEADAMHLRTDVYTSAGVFGGLVAIHFTGFTVLDPIIAMGVALLILKAAYDLTRNAFMHILDISLPDAEEKIIHEVLGNFSGDYVEYHKLRTRKSGAQRHIDMHLVVPRTLTIEQSHTLSDAITAKIKERLAYSHVLVHIEPCDGSCDNCAKKDCPQKERSTAPSSL
jgi:cation diffusion facilitator family transporter